MRFSKSLTFALALAASLCLVSGCATKAPLNPIYPPSVDLTVEAKPRLDPAALDSEQALIEHDVALEIWGERGWAKVGRLCRWAVKMGMPDMTCPPPPKPG